MRKLEAILSNGEGVTMLAKSTIVLTLEMLNIIPTCMLPYI